MPDPQSRTLVDPAPTPVSGPYPAETLQRLIDQAAGFNVFTTPDPNSAGAAQYAPGDPEDPIGFQVSQPLHRFDMHVELPSRGAGVRSANTVGEAVGRLDLRWMMIPYDDMALPGRESGPVRLDRSCSQRFV